ncbi:MAG: asparagine synthase (glutamine-hydrolyzing), partial [Vicinamibacterales bacterium]
LVSLEGVPPDAPRLATSMRDVLTHRGPDDAGLRCVHFAALAHRRLSIVDLRSGQQPLANEDGSIWVVFNGEIYNHAAIRRELEGRGHRYRTHSDTETIVHAYEEWGDDCIDRFRGMFAFAVWDSRRRRLLLVRDRLGVKPLYWAQTDGMLLFGSEIKAILASGLVEARPQLALLPELLSTRYISGPETLFSGVQKLLPGHRLVLEDGRVHISQYWDLPIADADSSSHRMPAREAAERFRDLLEESVRLRLMADVPLGMFLSGGIDSSAIAALMSRMVSRPVKTFSVGFSERAFSELGYARQVADAIGAEPNDVVIDDRDFFSALPRLVWHEDEPIAHPSSVPLYFVSKLAREQVTVVLTGEGSDELLAGYGKYPRIAWNWRAGTVYERMVPRALRAVVADRMLPALPGAAGRLARRSFLAMRRTPEAMFLDNFAAIRLADQHRLLSPALRVSATPENAYGPSLRSFIRPPERSSLLSRVLYADTKTYLVELLMKQDQMSMAASIESRVPFLDHTLVEFASALPDRLKLSGLTTKRVLREAMKGVLPDEILTRPKMGFPVPFSRWTRGAWNDVAREVLLDRRTRQRGLVDSAAVDVLLRDHAAHRTDAGDPLWMLMNLELWFRTFVDRGGVQSLPEPHRRTAPARTHTAGPAQPRLAGDPAA